MNKIVLVASAAAFLLPGAAANGRGQPDSSAVQIKTNPLGNGL